MSHIKLIVLVLCLVVTTSLQSAPAPFCARQTTHRSLKQILVGEWDMRWGSTTFRIVLSANGNYSAKLGSLHYVGSWSADGEYFRITESTRPEDALSWRSYCVRMDRYNVSGKEVNNGVEVRLTR